MESNEYFTASYYLPEAVYQRHKAFSKYLRNAHFCRRGSHPKTAERQFVQYVQQMEEYGMHLYSAIWVRFCISKSLIICMMLMEF